MLGIFTLWKNPSTPAGFEPANLGSSDEYDNHGTTGVDKINLKEVGCNAGKLDGPRWKNYIRA